MQKFDSAALVLDHYDDGGALARAQMGGEPPELTKTAADLSSVPRRDADYAVSFLSPRGVEHRFPIVDAGNALLSGVYYETTGALLPPELRKEAAVKLSDALQRFGFQPPPYLEKAASADFDASGWTTDDDSVLLKLFGVDGAADDQMELIRDEFEGLSPRGKRRFAMTVKQASVQLPADLAAYAGSTYGDDFPAAINMRKERTPDDMHPALDMVKLAARATAPDEMVEFLHEFDVSNNLTQFYGRALPDPYQSVYGTTKDKTATVKKASVTIGNREYSEHQVAFLAGVRRAKVEDVFGAELAAQLADRPIEVLDSLPGPHKLALARMMEAE